jgi:hypothetical protein
MFGKPTNRSLGDSRFVDSGRRAGFGHWRNQHLLFSSNPLTNLESLLYAWLWLSWFPQFRRWLRSL